MIYLPTDRTFLLLSLMKYGWEFPAQIFVIMIVFTYAVICPVILPFGALYFGFSLIVYKKQILYVYQPVFESGGAMFPGALQKTLFALALGQLTFIGYLFTRKALFQGLFLFPLPFATFWGMNYFHEYYGSKFRKKNVLFILPCRCLFWLAS